MKTTDEQNLGDPRSYVQVYLETRKIIINERGELKDGTGRNNLDIFDSLYLDYLSEVKTHNSYERAKAVSLRNTINTVAEKVLLKALTEMIGTKKIIYRKEIINSFNCEEEDLSLVKKYVKALTGSVNLDDVAILAHWMWQVKNKMMDRNPSYHIMPIFYGKQGGGKCLKEGTLVKTPQGSVEIQNLKAGDQVYGYNKDGSVSLTTVTKLWNQGIKDVYDLKSFNETIATCTDEHKWVVKRKCGKEAVKKLKDFNKTDRLKIVNVDINGGDKIVPTAYAIGALLGDGCSTLSGLIMSSQDENIVSKVSKCLGLQYNKQKSSNYSWTLYTDSTKKYYSEYYSEWCQDRKAHEKVICYKEVITWDRGSQIELLSGLIDTDGSVYKTKTNSLKLAFHSQSKILVETVSRLLLDLFQVQATVKIDNRLKYVNGPVYHIKIAGNQRIINILKELNTVVESKQFKKEYNELPQRFYKEDFVTVVKSESYKAQCWDITVDNETHLFLLANGTITHNTVAMSKLIAPMNNFRLNISLDQMTDDRYFKSMAENYVIVFDEMQGAGRSDIDALKKQVTIDYNDYRPMGTNEVYKVKQACSFIGATNRPVAEQIIDSSGMRRFWQVDCSDKLDWDTISNIDYDLMWKGINESKKDGYILTQIDSISKKQEEMVSKDDLTVFMEEFGIELNDKPTKDIAISDLYEEYKSFCEAGGYKAMNLSWFGRKMRNKGILGGTKHDPITRKTINYLTIPETVKMTYEYNNSNKLFMAVR